MGQLRKLAAHSSWYLVSNMLVVAAGAISMPIWTRFLSQQDYGVFSLLNVTIAFLVIFSKFGLQHAALRFYSDVSAKQSAASLPSYYTTMVIGGMVTSAVVTAAMLGLVALFLHDLDFPSLPALLPLVGTVIVIQAANNILTMFMRAEQQVKLYSVIHVVRRYSRLGFAVLMVLLFGVHLYNIYLGWILSGAMIFTLLFTRLLRQQRLAVGHFSPALLKEAVVYGFPLIWFELSNAILSLGDRYVIQYYLGAAAVGVYSVGYNTADLAQSVLTLPLRLAVIPLYLSLWNGGGEEKTRHFLGQALKYYFMLGIPLALGVSWYSRDLVLLLATEKFIAAHTIVPYIIFPMILYGAFGIYGAGLYIQKKTTHLMSSTLFASAANILLNVLMVPRLGLLGAALATLIAYVLLSILIFWRSSSYLKIPVELSSIGKFGAIAAATVYLVSAVAGSAQFVLQISIVIVLYSATVLLLDKQLRAKARSALMD